MGPRHRRDAQSILEPPKTNQGLKPSDDMTNVGIGQPKGVMPFTHISVYAGHNDFLFIFLLFSSTSTLSLDHLCVFRLVGQSIGETCLCLDRIRKTQLVGGSYYDERNAQGVCGDCIKRQSGSWSLGILLFLRIHCLIPFISYLVYFASVFLLFAFIEKYFSVHCSWVKQRARFIDQSCGRLTPKMHIRVCGVGHHSIKTRKETFDEINL